MDIELRDLDILSDEEFISLEQSIDRELSVWEIQNLRGQAAIFHDDQHIGEKRRELMAFDHPSFNVQAELDFRRKPVVDSLEGNMLVHPLSMPVIEVDQSNTKARAVWWSMGIEGLSKYREKPMAIISFGMVPGTYVKEHGEWKILSGAWQRTTKNEYHAGWVENMEPTNTRPPLTREQDRNFLGKHAYQKDTVRRPVPEPPRKNTWDQFPDETDDSWKEINLKEQKADQ